MIYLLDAYNIIHKIPSLEAALDRDLRSAREALIALCGKFASRGDVSRMLLVFDGKSEFNDLPNPAPAKIRIVFSETGEDADERIGLILGHLPREMRKTVVSDDNSVLNHARVFGAKGMSVAEFERLIRGKNKNKPGLKSRYDDFSLPPKIAREITEAYKKELGID